MKWSILIECSSENMKEFETQFYIKDEVVISREFVNGIMKVDESTE